MQATTAVPAAAAAAEAAATPADPTTSPAIDVTTIGNQESVQRVPAKDNPQCRLINLMLRFPEMVQEGISCNMPQDWFSDRYKPLVQAILYQHGVSGGKRLLTESQFRALLKQQGVKGNITIAMEPWHECRIGVSDNNSRNDWDMLVAAVAEEFVQKESLAATHEYVSNIKTLGYQKAAAILGERMLKASNISTGRTLDIVTMDQVTEESLDWLWYRRLPIGMLSAIYGDGGAGKSMMLVDIVARLTRGDALPDDPRPRAAGDVLILSCEDGRSHTLKPRLRKQGAVMPRVAHIRGFSDGANLNLAQDLSTLRRILFEKPYQMLIIDPVTAYMGNRVNTNTDNEVRHVLNPLSTLAEDFKIAIVLVMHVNKDKNKAAVDRILGSVAFRNLTRMVWAVTPAKDNPDRKLLVAAKWNIVPREENALAFKIYEDVDELPKLEWENQRVAISAEEAFSADTPRSVAVEWLKEYLDGKSKKSSSVFKEAQDAGISKRTLERAKAELQVESFKLQDVWWWRLPTQKALDFADKNQDTDVDW